MNKKLLAVPLATILSFGSIAPAYASTSTIDDSTSTAEVKDSPSISNIDKEVIKTVDPYVSVSKGEFVIKNKDGLKNELSTKEYEKVITSVKQMNKNVEESSNLKYGNDTITVAGKSSQPSTHGITTFSAGKSGVEFHWWGYKTFLDHGQARQIRNVLLGGATTAGVVNQISPWFSAPTAVIKAIAGAIAAGGTGLAGMIAANDEGEGIWIRVTGYAVYTGIGPQ